jgi:hypothetical protein
MDLFLLLSDNHTSPSSDWKITINEIFPNRAGCFITKTFNVQAKSTDTVKQFLDKVIVS